MAIAYQTPRATTAIRFETARIANVLGQLFRRSFLGSLVLASAISTAATAQLQVRVVDVGAGLCCVAVTSDGHYMIYDAGNFRDRGETAMIAIEQIIPYGSTIDLLVLSHCDADHIAAVPFICENYIVKEVWRDGLDSGRDTWDRADEAIRQEVLDDGCEDVNLQEVDVEPGYAVDVGNTTVTFLCGFADIPSEWDLGGPSSGENKNARSIVVRMDHGDASIMFAGDTVGRHIEDSWHACIAAERFLVDNAANVPIDVDVMVAPHHGADNGSSYPFIQAASPNSSSFQPGRTTNIRTSGNGIVAAHELALTYGQHGQYDTSQSCFSDSCLGNSAGFVEAAQRVKALGGDECWISFHRATGKLNASWCDDVQNERDIAEWSMIVAVTLV